jgi:multidrug efflux pump subunit AcrB
VTRSWLGRNPQFLNDQLDRLRDLLAVALRWSLNHRWAVVVIGVFSIGASFGRLGSSFMPQADEAQFRVAYKAVTAGTPARDHG